MANRTTIILSLAFVSATNAAIPTFSDIQNVQEKVDTFVVVDCSESAYHPFGNSSTKSEFIQKLSYALKHKAAISIDSTSVITPMDTVWLRANWCFGSECETTRSNILAASISTNKIAVRDAIRVGMTRRDFFRKAVGIKEASSRLVIVESCVDDLQQAFEFSGNHLMRIRISSINWILPPK